MQKYLGFVEQHLQKLESYRDEEKAGTFSIGNRVMRALVEESEERMRHCPDTEIKDVCLLACIQVINHFKISAFGTAAAFANELKMEKAAAIFHEMEINEKHIDDRLSQLAEHELNKKARTPILITG